MSRAAPAVTRVLDATDFRKVAVNGFGDGLNSYAHTMTWFRDRLFVGTTRANLCMVQTSNPLPMRCWPVDCPQDIYDLDRRAQIWSLAPAEGEWERVLVSPMVEGPGGVALPRDIGYRGMTVFQGTSDREPALYVSTWSPSRTGKPPVVLRSTGGRIFRPVSEPYGGDPALNTYRTLVPFRGRLYTSPTGRTSGWQGAVHRGAKENMSGAPVVFVTEDPATRPWRAASAPGFGDPRNLTVFEMAEFAGHLYAGTLNPERGFELWKTRAAGPPPYRWRRVLEQGAYRGPLNEAVVSLCPFGDALYVGTGVQNGGYDRTYHVGPAAAELLRVFPDDSWELLVGEPRRTPDGHRLPLSGLGAGFDDFFNGYLWRMAVHDGCLYAGTYNWTVMLPYLTLQRWPDWARDLVRWEGVEHLARRQGGFDLWRTADGLDWTPVTRDGFGNPYNYGARTMVSTPSGLFVGTANPFGPTVAVREGRGWRYAPNPAGGLEVWLGAPGRGNGIGAARGDGRVRPVALHLDGHGPDGATLDGRRNGKHDGKYDDWMYDELVNAYYDYSDFQNFGFWRPETLSQREACENLMEELLRPVRKTGSVLDVACGKGATTRYLLRYFDAGHVTGINVSERQLASCRLNAPGCTFLRMDAARLDFPAQSFDHVICVEAAFHFRTRADFLREACRVLVPGGDLVLSDILFASRDAERRSPFLHAANHVETPEAYAALLRAAGFEEVHVRDATPQCWRGFAEHCLAFLRARVQARDVSRPSFSRAVLGLLLGTFGIRSYVLVSARKPARAS